MRVLLTTDPIGGVWTFTKELATGLLHAGHSVALVSFGAAPTPDQLDWCSASDRRHGSAFRYDACLAPLEWMQANDAVYTAAEPFLLRIADDFSPDLLHSNQFCFGRLPVPIPRIVTAHSDVLSWADACRPAGLKPSPWLALYRDLVQSGLNGAHAVVAPTEWMLNALEKNFPLSCPKQVILNGRSLPSEKKTERRELQAVSAGRFWDEAKNLNIFLQTDSPLPIVIAGDLQHDGGATPSLPPSISFSGKLDEGDLLALFRASSIYVATSIYEPFGLAPLEAALCGCAVLANDIPSFREVWGEAALYFDNSQNLHRTLATLRPSPERLKRFRHNSMRRALQLTGARMTQSYTKLYTELTSAGRQTAVRELTIHA